MIKIDLLQESATNDVNVFYTTGPSLMILEQLHYKSQNFGLQLSVPQSMLGKLVLFCYLLYSRTFEVPGYELLFLQSQPPSLPPTYLLVYGQNTEMCLHKKYNEL
jgi:hypothetical protein